MYIIMDDRAKQQYIDMMEGIKQLNKQVVGWGKKQKGLPADNVAKDTDYFLDERIAVYTCIIGKYDRLKEPVFVPDNCDFFAITDQEVPATSKWRKIVPEEFFDRAAMNNPVMVNRFFKINPFSVFENYRYSLYIDGSFKIYTDMTEYVNRISDYGMGFFHHPERNCVFQEIEACRRMNKDKEKCLDAQYAYLKAAGMPEGYGLLGGGVIARDHNNILCKEVMGEWWEEYQKYPGRDQISLPYVLYKNQIVPADLATLGQSYLDEYSYRQFWHE